MEAQQRSPLIGLCEFRENPIEIQSENPRLSWKMENSGSMQNSYRLYVGRCKEDVLQKQHLIWDSGRMLSCDTLVHYSGEPLKSFTRYWWSMEITTESGEEFAAPLYYWETAALLKTDWEAEWISSPTHIFGRSDLFTKSFYVDSKVEQARLYISGLGYYEVFINGKKVEDRVLEPGWTDYRKRVLYSVYDVSNSINPGHNILGTELAEGWYGFKHESFLKYMASQPKWNGVPCLRSMLKIKLTDGREININSSSSGGFYTAPGGVMENSIYDGETFDARKAYEEWSLKGVHEYGLPAAAAASPPEGIMVAQELPPIRILERLTPVKANVLTDRKTVYDFGVNFSGWISIKVKGSEGSSVIIKYAEVTRADGTVNQDNLRGAKCCDKYILKGGEAESWHPRFTYHGFRFAELEICGDAEIIEVEGHFVASDVIQIGAFNSSNDIINTCFDAILRTERSNLHSVPTDCPQRDERMAWLNDVTVRCEEAMLNFDMRLFFEKWMDDIVDAQTEHGAIPDTAPHVYCGNPSFHISSCIILIPWFIKKYYGDESAIKKYYPQMKKYLYFLNSQRGNDGIIGAPYFGEWAPPAAECNQSSPWAAEPSKIPPGIITSCYLAYDCLLMEKMCEISGYSEDKEAYANIFKSVAGSINECYYNPSKKYYEGGQAGNIFPVILGIAPDTTAVKEYLLNDLSSYDFHMTTGNQMTKHWFELLDQIGRNDIALKVASKTTYPSLGYMIESGATTIWERWENLSGSGMNSHNHPMNGAYTAWYYKGLAGIKFSGGNAFELVPAIDLDINYVEAKIKTPNGNLLVKFEKAEAEIMIEIDIPFNSSAWIKLKEPPKPYQFSQLCAFELQSSYTLEKGFIMLYKKSGSYRFSIKCKNV